MKVYFMRIDAEAIIPHRAHEDDAGLDLYSIEDKTIKPWGRELIRTGICWMPIFCKDPIYLHVQPRSSMSVYGIDVGAGIVDKGYRNEIKVLLINNTTSSYTIHPKEKIAQAIIYTLPAVEVEETEDVDVTARGLGGFGSTGK